MSIWNWLPLNRLLEMESSEHVNGPKGVLVSVAVPVAVLVGFTKGVLVGRGVSVGSGVKVGAFATMGGPKITPLRLPDERKVSTMAERRACSVIKGAIPKGVIKGWLKVTVTKTVSSGAPGSIHACPALVKPP